MLLSKGQMSDYRGAALMIDAFPNTGVLLGDRGYDAEWFRQALIARGIASKICSAKSKTGDASTHDTIAAHTQSCPQSAAQPPSYSDSINES